MLQNEYVQGLREALLKLPPINRQALIMHQCGLYPYQEVADRLGLPRNTVAARIHRAREQLRRLLGLPEPVRTIIYSESKEAIMERYVIAQNPAGVEGDTPITRMVNVIILNAVKEHADEILVESTTEYTAVRYHIGEQWHDIMTLPTFAHVPMLQWVKEITAIDQVVSAPQHGMIYLQVNQQDYDARTNITPGEHGEILALKITQAA